MFQLNEKETDFLRSQIGTSKEASIQVVRSFIQLREFVISHSELSKKLFELEKKYDSQFKVVFDAVEKLMVNPEVPYKKIGI